MSSASGRIGKLLKLSFLIFILLWGSSTTNALENPTELNSNNIVFLIVDGLGASYIYPEYQPRALDDSILQKPNVKNLSIISSESIRFLDVSTIALSGNSGHNSLITGNLNADEKMVAYPNTTIYDVLHNRGYVAVAIMEKGDSPEIIAEQDIVLHDTTNSINDVSMEVKTNNPDIVHLSGIRNILETHAEIAPEAVENEKEGSISRYYAYNEIVFDGAEDVILEMEKSEVPYILTLNAGAIDNAGHYRGNEGYVQTIEHLDKMILPLYELCRDNGIILVITSDHGIAFPDPDSRGGVQSGDYFETAEVKRIPLIIYSPDLKPQIIEYPADQQDIAPTMLSILDIPENPHFCEGKRFHIKEYATLGITTDTTSSIRVLNEGRTLYSSNLGFNHNFRKLELDTSYRLVIFDIQG
ncbi:bisphosphoglycerate-independent phosphoglycerate mutase (AlkP superfamily) [Methanohalophilus levihalophilus]|uniref:sulfatase-like hydrolase/transferase n=1 Tax=Methanohalophilus levihalophilus TaxID=1431282 RepID=UPI001AE39191|nr:sulfatase-like hydrolase/transferase [Methanohalophilus levihalophilus]MBP2029590.1 bisphosphoglycerate-independent phosphoglycerate mutase (AlkP superfamily) [Methanohalophilus levihalophilus]